MGITDGPVCKGEQDSNAADNINKCLDSPITKADTTKIALSVGLGGAYALYSMYEGNLSPITALVVGLMTYVGYSLFECYKKDSNNFQPFQCVFGNLTCTLGKFVGDVAGAAGLKKATKEVVKDAAGQAEGYAAGITAVMGGDPVGAAKAGYKVGCNTGAGKLAAKALNTIINGTDKALTAINDSPIGTGIDDLRCAATKCKSPQQLAKEKKEANDAYKSRLSSDAKAEGLTVTQYLVKHPAILQDPKFKQAYDVTMVQQIEQMHDKIEQEVAVLGEYQQRPGVTKTDLWNAALKNNGVMPSMIGDTPIISSRQLSSDEKAKLLVLNKENQKNIVAGQLANAQQQWAKAFNAYEAAAALYTKDPLSMSKRQAALRAQAAAVKECKTGMFSYRCASAASGLDNEILLGNMLFASKGSTAGLQMKASKEDTYRSVRDFVKNIKWRPSYHDADEKKLVAAFNFAEQLKHTNSTYLQGGGQYIEDRISYLYGNSA